MTININELKNTAVLEEEKAFFKKFKKSFITTFNYYYKEYYNCDHCILDVDTIANNFYEALFDNDKDCYERNLCCLFKMKENGIDAGFMLADMTNEIIQDFLNQNQDSSLILTQVRKILEITKEQMKVLKTLTSDSLKEKKFEVTSSHAMQATNIAYLKNLSNLGRNIKFFVHTQVGTCMSFAKIEQIGNNSVIIKVSDEQMTALKLANNCFIIKNGDREKNFAVKAKILCAQDFTVILEDIIELQTLPLLSRKYPRAAIIHASLVHLANENEYITGNMIDISEGGVGVISSDKSTFQKGQEIVAFLSYEDPATGYKFSFEATGYIASILGKENAFRYGLALNLSEEEKELIRHLVVAS